MWAHIHECRIQAEKVKKRPTFANRAAPLLPSPNQHSSNSIVPSPTRKMTSTFNHPPLKCLTHSEIQSPRERGLCYYCEEKYVVAHKCKTPPQLLLLTEGSTRTIYLWWPIIWRGTNFRGPRAVCDFISCLGRWTFIIHIKISQAHK